MNFFFFFYDVSEAMPHGLGKDGNKGLASPLTVSCRCRMQAIKGDRPLSFGLSLTADKDYSSGSRKDVLGHVVSCYSERCKSAFPLLCGPAVLAKNI
jgi:hypothetical protein